MDNDWCRGVSGHASTSAFTSCTYDAHLFVTLAASRHQADALHCFSQKAIYQSLCHAKHNLETAITTAWCMTGTHDRVCMCVCWWLLYSVYTDRYKWASRVFEYKKHQFKFLFLTSRSDNCYQIFYMGLFGKTATLIAVRKTLDHEQVRQGLISFCSWLSYILLFFHFLFILSFLSLHHYLLPIIIFLLLS